MIKGRPPSKYDYITHPLSFELSTIHRYIVSIDRAIEKEKVEVKNYIKKHFPIEEYDSYASIETAMLMQAEDHNPNLFYKSCVIVLYTLSENIFRKLCKLLYESENYKVKPSDLRGDGIERYFNYLKNVAEIDLKPVENAWKDLNYYRHIRNMIVHHNGNAEEYNKFKSVSDFIEKRKELTIDSDNHIKIIDKSILFEFCDLIDVFFKRIIEKCPN